MLNLLLDRISLTDLVAFKGETCTVSGSLGHIRDWFVHHAAGLGRIMLRPTVDKLGDVTTSVFSAVKLVETCLVWNGFANLRNCKILDCEQTARKIEEIAESGTVERLGMECTCAVICDNNRASISNIWGKAELNSIGTRKNWATIKHRGNGEGVGVRGCWKARNNGGEIDMVVRGTAVIKVDIDDGEVGVDP